MIYICASCAAILIVFAETNALKLDSILIRQRSRRDFGFLVPVAIVSTFRVQSVSAVVLEQKKENVFAVGMPMNIDDAKKRFQDAQLALSKEGGDNVRRYLGTVGTTSPLYGISRVTKELQNEAKDVVEYTENMQDFDYFLRAADTAVYSANFVEYSAAKTKPEKFFDEARSDCIKMTLYMKKMSEELQLI